MHNKFSIFFVLFAIAMLTGCQSMAPCGGGDKRPWKILSDPPANSKTLRALANDAYPITKGWSDAKEKWFHLGTDQVMLCLGRFDPEEESYGFWWQFTSDNGQYVISEQLGWVHVD